MSIGILGKKLGMSQFFDDEGRAVPVTVIEAGPCRITQVKTPANDGYSAVQVGFGDVREKLVNQPAKGHLKKSGEDLLRHLKEEPTIGANFHNLTGRAEVGRDFREGLLESAGAGFLIVQIGRVLNGAIDILEFFGNLGLGHVNNPAH